MTFIGISMSFTSGRGPDRVSLNTSYFEALQWAGAIPVLLPPRLDAPSLRTLLESLDGVMLTGGGDVDPALYGEQPHRETVGVAAARDRMELDVIHRTLDARKPLFAICRGMQMMNVALGGSLYQHVPDHFGDSVFHQQEAAGYNRDEPTHTVEVRGGSLLANLVGSGRLGVNSLHHQAVRVPGTHVIVTARAGDGVIEAIEAPALGSFVLGVQWHPEELMQTPAARALFQGFVAACREPAEAELVTAR
jgi:putative glutamine amidotransferase